MVILKSKYARKDKTLCTFWIHPKLWKAFDAYCKQHEVKINGMKHTPSKSEVITNFIFAICSKSGLITEDDLKSENVEENKSVGDNIVAEVDHVVPADISNPANGLKVNVVSEDNI